MASDTGFFLERQQRIYEVPPRPQRAWCLTVARSSKRRFPKSETHVACPEDSDERWHIFASFPQPEPLRGFEHAGGHPPQTISWKDCFQAVWTLLNDRF